MNLRALPRVFAWAFLTGFLTDLLRRCLIVEAHSVFPVAAFLLLIVLWRLLRACRDFLRKRSIDFIRPVLPRDDTH